MGTIAADLRVLHVIDSLAAGGAERSLAHMAPGYRDMGMDLHVAFLKSRWDVADDLRKAGAVLHPIALDESRLRQAAGLVGLIRRLRPSIVHTTLWESNVLGRLAAASTGTPVVSTFTTSSYSPVQDDPSVSWTKLRLVQVVDGATARLPVRFQAVSGQVAADMAARLWVNPDRIVVIPRARRPEVLGEPSPERRDRVRQSLGIAPDAPVVLAVARHEHQKGLDVLIRAVGALGPRLADATVIVAGRPGRATDSLTALVEQLGLTRAVRFLGARDDVADLIVAADVVAVPSRVEGMPGAVLEAMALERPIVASDIPMIREAVGDCAAALTPVDNPRLLARAIEGAFAADTSTTTAAARARFDAKFTPERVADRLLAFYEESIALSRWSRSRSV